MKKEKVTIDSLLEKIPNKYVLAIVAGKLAKKEFDNGLEKVQIMDDVFSKILNDEVEYKNEIKKD